MTHRRTRRRRGAVLAVVLWLLIIIVIVALSFAYNTQLSAKGTGNTDNQARSYYAALSGIERLCAELDEGAAQTGVYYTAPGGTWERIDSDQEPVSPEAE